MFCIFHNNWFKTAIKSHDIQDSVLNEGVKMFSFVESELVQEIENKDFSYGKYKTFFIADLPKAYPFHRFVWPRRLDLAGACGSRSEKEKEAAESRTRSRRRSRQTSAGWRGGGHCSNPRNPLA